MSEALRIVLEGVVIVLWLSFLAVVVIAVCVALAVLLLLASAWAVDLTAGWWP